MRYAAEAEPNGLSGVGSDLLPRGPVMIRLLPTTLLAAALLAATAQAQTAGPTSGAPAEKPASPAVALCKNAALHTLSTIRHRIFPMRAA